MRFEIQKIVQTPDPEMVLRALEMCSQEISSEVVRSGDRITLRGVGPSPRSKNKHDTTVFFVNAANNETVIQGEVNFQASALLGDTSQKEVVRSKLDELFEQMKAQIHLDSMRVAAYAAARKSAASSTTGVAPSTTVIDRPEDPNAMELRESEPSEEKLWPSEEKTASAVAPEAVVPEAVIEAMTAAPDSGWGATALADLDEPQGIALPDPIGEFRHSHAESMASAPPIEHRPADVEADINGGPTMKDGPERSTRAIDSAPTATQTTAETKAQTEGQARPTAARQAPLWEAARNPVRRPKPDAGLGREEELTWEARIPPYRLRLEEDRTSGWKKFARGIAVLATLLALAGVGYRLYSLHPDLFAYPVSIAAKYVPAAAKYTPPPAIGAPAVPASLPTIPLPATANAAKVPLAKTSPPMPSPPAPTTEPAASSAEVKRWLQGWASSMQTRDANAQASFYADKLDRYLEQRNVGRAAVLRDREATNRMRKGLWTVKIEDIVIERQTDSEAELRLMKHFIVEPEQSEILESFVPTRLTLKRINGQWKITSEQDQPTISVSPWKAQGGLRRDQEMPGVKEEAQSSIACVDGCAS
jgi:ketosteroid isomerase-like protein